MKAAAPAALLAAFAMSAAAQSPMPFSGEAPAASTAPAVAASTTAAVAASTDTLANVVTSTGGVKIAGGVKAKLVRPMHAVIHAEAKEWEPLSVRAGGDPFQAETKAVVRQEKVRGKYKGAPVKASASARLYKAGHDRWLVVRVFPKGLIEKRRIHFEVRLKIVEGFVEEAKASVVTVVDQRPGVGDGLDAYELRDRGVEFEEDSPASGTLLISALDPRPSKAAVNSGTLKLGAFANKAVGLADASWAVKGLPPPK